MSFDAKIYSRVPKRVYAIQYFPYAELPQVKDIIIKVPEMPASFYAQPDPNDVFAGGDMSQVYSNGVKTIDVCTHGEVMLGGNQKAMVKPKDFVIYNEQSKVAIGVVPKDDFLEMYTDKFDLCEVCLKKAQDLTAARTAPKINLTITEIMQLIQSGEGYKLDDGTLIKSLQELADFAGKNGIKL